MRIRSPDPDVPADAGLVKCMVTSSALPEDRVEHVHVRAASRRCVDVVLLISVAEVADAQTSGAALICRLLVDHLPGWHLQKLWLEPMA
jgi:hypothetical protein